MNKTLLLIICDFLLLNLIHFTAWDEIENSKDNPGAGGAQSTGAGMGDPQRDLELVRMQFKQSTAELDEQKRAYINLSNTATESQQASAKKIDDAEQKALGWYKKAQEEGAGKKAAEEAARIALEQLKNRTTQANLSEEEKKALEAERKKLEAQAAKLEGDVNTLEINLNAANEKAAEDQERAMRALNAANARAKTANDRADKGIAAANTRAEAANTRAEAATTRAQTAEVNMATANATANAAQKQAAAANTRAQTAEQKVETVSTELTKTKVNLKAAQVAEEVALGAVKEMGGNVAEIKSSAQAIIDNTPISANTLFRQFRGRGVKVWLKSGRTTTRTDTVLIQQGNYVYALLHTSDTPFPISPKATGISRVEPTLSTPEAGKAKPVAYTLPFAQFLKDEPRVLASPLMNVPQAASRGIRPYQIAAKPFQFPKAFVISRDGKSYGEVEFKFNPAHQGYVKMDKPFAGGLFSNSFNPSKGDLVLSQKGELLGMMANNSYCYVISSLKSESSITFRKDLNRTSIAKTLKAHNATIQRKAFDLR